MNKKEYSQFVENLLTKIWDACENCSEDEKLLYIRGYVDGMSFSSQELRGFDLNNTERFEIWETLENKDVLDFPIGEMDEKQTSQCLDKLGIPSKIRIIKGEIILIGGKYKSNVFPYIVVEKNLLGNYDLFQVDNINDVSDEHYELLGRLPIKL